MSSISAVQTKGLKRHWNTEDEVNFNSEVLNTDNVDEDSKKPKKLNSVAGSKKRMRLLAVMSSLDQKKKTRDPNVVGLEVT